MSESTVKSHIARIYQKLGASNRAQALVTAMRIGLLSSVQRQRGLKSTASPGADVGLLSRFPRTPRTCRRMARMDYSARIESAIRSGRRMGIIESGGPPAFSALKSPSHQHL